MNSKIIFGITDLADVLYENLRREGKSIEAFTVNKKYIKEETHLGKPVIPFEEIEKKYPKDSFGIYLCVGYNKMNKSREALYNKIKEKGYSLLSYVHPTAIIMTDDIEDGNLIFENVSIGAFTVLGKCNICYPNSLIAHHSNVGNFNFFSISSSIAGNCSVKDNCFLGNNCTTKDGIKISKHVLVGAGAYVDRDLNEYEVIVPQKSIVLKKHKSIDFL